MKTIDTSTSDFPRIIQNNHLFVDKTLYIWKLLQAGSGSFFLSRPRRFGKSLLLSTLHALFEGRRELFKGLAIDNMDYDWKPHPVIHLDFGDCGVKTSKELNVYLEGNLAEAVRGLGFTLRGEGLAMRFGNLITDMAEGCRSQVVLLIDEYDKPILENLRNPAREDVREIMRTFYSVVKKQERNIRFAFITGVSKFSHVSLFSGLNNLTDLTLNDDYAGMLGFTEAEIRRDFADRIPLAAKANGMGEGELMRNLLQWYDGYRFSTAETHVCNPVSISKFFYNNGRFSNYWIDTGTPSFLLKLLDEQQVDLAEELQQFHDSDVFSPYEFDFLPAVGLLWQTGYLTIAETRMDGIHTQYRLDFPDSEVRETFSRNLLRHYGGEKAMGPASAFVSKCPAALRRGDCEEFMRLFQSFLASVPYTIQIKHEKYYQTVFFVAFNLIGARIEAESCTNQGRIDAYIRTDDAVYVFEFKLDKPAGEALGQIVERCYIEKFAGSGLPIVHVGAAFDSRKGALTEWVVVK